MRIFQSFNRSPGATDTTSGGPLPGSPASIQSSLGQDSNQTWSTPHAEDTPQPRDYPLPHSNHWPENNAPPEEDQNDEHYPWNEQPPDDEEEANRAAIRDILREENPFNLRRPNRPVRYTDESVSPSRQSSVFFHGSENRLSSAESATNLPLLGPHHPSTDRQSTRPRTRNEQEEHEEEISNYRLRKPRKRMSERVLDEDWEEQEENNLPKRRALETKGSKLPSTLKLPHGTKSEVKTCEFSSPCRMKPSPDGMHWRKVVSHIFGRNKASTKIFPDDVWVHYCRKHYQRARYRADQWPFTQCELILESLLRMEDWGGVKCFELVLRRREQARDLNETPSAVASQTRLLNSGRRHPTAITAPVPDWLRKDIGKNKSFEEIRRIVERVRDHMMTLRTEEKNKQWNDSPSTQHISQRGSNPRLSLRYRHGGWQSLSSPTDGREPPRTAQMSRVRFPDVEILPTFHNWVYTEEIERQREDRAACTLVARAEAREVNDEAEPSQSTNGVNGEEMESERAHRGHPDPGTYRQRLSSSQDPRHRRSLPEQVTRVSSRGAVKKPHPAK